MSKYIGLQNYINLFSDKAFLQAIGNSLIYAAMIIPICVSIPLFMAIMSYRYKERVKNLMRFGFYIPALTSPLVLASIWLFIFDYRRGVVSWILGLFGAKPVIWFGSQLPAIFVIVILLSLVTIGNALLLYMAVLQSIPSTTIDAAMIDGATWWQIRLRILIPIILPWILFLILIHIIAAFQIIEIIWRMTSGGPHNSTATMLYNIYETGFIRSAYGMASAKSLAMLVILLLLAFVKSRIEGKEEKFI